MSGDDRSLARLTLKIWMIAAPACVLSGISSALLLKSYGLRPQLNMAITFCIVFLPVPIIALYGLLRGYLPAYDLQSVHRGRTAAAINAVALIVYAAAALVVLLLA